jgi:FKBP-type peptidyl-prolyl cis-trans isomerase
MRAFVAIALCASACTSGSSVPDLTDTIYATSLGVDLASSSLLSNGEYVRDLSVGTGPPVLAGQTVSLFFSAYLPDGTLVGTNEGLAPDVFVLGAGAQIAGIDQGLGGMNVGGVRQLVIPPALAYGDIGFETIPPQAILVENVRIAAAQ